MGILACCCSYTDLLQFCRVSYGLVKLNKIRNAVFGISKSNIVPGFHCLRRQDMFTLLILVIYKFCNAGSGIQRSLSVCVDGLEFCFLSQKALRICRQFCTKPNAGPQIPQCSLAALK